MQLFEFERIQKIWYKLRSYRIQEQLPIALLMQQQNGWESYQQGSFFGEKNHYYSFKGEVEVPKKWQGKQVALRIYSSLNEWDNTTNPQIKVSLDGQFLQTIDVNHQEVYLSQSIFEKKSALNLELFSGREEKQFPLYVELIAIDSLIDNTTYDFYTLMDSWRAIRKFGGNQVDYQTVLSQAADVLDFRAPYSANFYASVERAQEILQQIFQAVAPSHQKVTAVGHTHIDLAWLWTAQQAVEKGERSFQTVLKLMDEFPDYTFFQSQPQMYQAIKTQFPELYQAIKEKIAEGRWEVDGAMWVEADCNLTSGESLVRQILYGKRFIKEEFDKESQILWLPDVFGYSAALPQILKKSRTPYFMTTKLSWNQFNQIPYDSFYWQGIDGSRVLTHFITTISEGYSPRPYYTTYNGLLDPYTIKGSFERYLQKEKHDEILLAYGYGDGGGGPTRKMLEVQKRLKQPLPDMPTITGDHVSGFFQRLAQAFKATAAPVWYGELYFEYHRGTLTSIGKNKRANRQGEFLLQSLEKLFSMNRLSTYPSQALHQMWQQLLFNQFHDILPGSSIAEVYQQTDQEYAELFAKGHELLQELAEQLPKANTKATGITVFNSLGISRDIVLELAGDVIGPACYPMQQTSEGKLLLKLPEMASLSHRQVPLEQRQQPSSEPIVQPLESQLETTDFVVKFTEGFEIASLYDKRHNREVVPDGEILNQLIAYEDLPMDYDAWDIDIYYERKPYPVNQVGSAQLVEQGDIRDTIQIIRPFEQSTITQRIHFYHGTGRIDFETQVDWHQHHLLLKAQIPIAVNALEATFDIQFGHVRRAVHRNTSWDMARFESCGQKWVDLSESGFGVSVLTDSKYGFNTAYQKIGVSLIKSATDPYPEADQGLHVFTYSIYVHEGDWQQAQTMEEALDLNVEPILLPGLIAAEEQAFLSVDQKNILLDTVKKAEDEEALIVRLYEFHNRRTTCFLRTQKPVKKAVLTNLLEEEEHELFVEEQSVEIPFAPFEIQTIKLYF